MAANQGALKSKHSSGLPTSIDEDAKSDLQSLAKWLEKAEMVRMEENRWRCVDRERLEKLRPLLEKLDLYQEGYIFTLSRVSGRTKIGKDRELDNLFFPLSGAVDVCGLHLELGQYIRFTSEQVFDAQLDFLVVSVPETTSYKQ